jgi:hypothetical protein
MESIASVEKAMDEGDYDGCFKKLNYGLATDGVTTPFTAPIRTARSVTGTEISTLVDNVILLRDIESTGTLKRSLTTLKAGAMAHQRDIGEFYITPKSAALRKKPASTQRSLRSPREPFGQEEAHETTRYGETGQWSPRCQR